MRLIVSSLSRLLCNPANLSVVQVVPVNLWKFLKLFSLELLGLKMNLVSVYIALI